jgi:anthranilate/para-aminobenzoate synthase component I
VREYIYAGDIFQANLSSASEGTASALPPWEFYRTLRRVNHAPVRRLLRRAGAPY